MASTEAATHQSRPIPGREDDMVLNSTGGYVFDIDAKQQLYRWLIMGATGTYYATAEKLKFENAMNIKALLDAGAGPQVVAAVLEVSEEGRAAKQDPGLFALAMCAALGDAPTKKAALEALPRVCRTATTLFTFLSMLKELGKVAQAEAGATDPHPCISWGRAMRKAVGAWYLGKGPEALAYQVTKYLNRAGWTHADVLRCAHPSVPKQLHKVQQQQQRGGAGAGGAKRARLAGGDGEGGQGVVEVTAADALAACSLSPSPAGSPEASEPSGADDVPMEAGAEAVGGGTAGTAAPSCGRKRSAPEAEPAAAAVAPAQLQQQEGGEGEASKAAAAAAAAGERGQALQLVLAYGSKGTLPDEALAAAGAAQSDQEQLQPQGEGGEAALEEEGGASASQQRRGVVARVARYLRAAHALRKLVAAPPPPPAQPEGVEPASPSSAAAAAAAAPASTPSKPSGRGRRAGRGARGRGGRKPGRRFGRVQQLGMEVDGEGEEGALVAKRAAPAVDPEVVSQAVGLIKAHRFGWEHVGDQRLLRCPALWAAFLEGGMPMTAMVRNLGRMGAAGVFEDATCVAAVTKALTDPAAISASKLHPLGLLEALRVYSQGRGEKGSLAWAPHQAIRGALEEAFYLSFKTLAPTGKRFLLGVDVSGSMDGCPVCGMAGLTAREAATAFAMALLRTEAEGAVDCMAFAGGFQPLPLSREHSLEAAISMSQQAGHNMDGTDCSRPMQWALRQKLEVDCFVVLTDNETYAGHQAPAEALAEYRKAMGRPEAKLIVLATSVTSFTIADPTDPLMLDVAGLDAAVPRLVAEFVAGKL